MLKTELLEKLNTQIDLRKSNGFDVNVVVMNNITSLLMFSECSRKIVYRNIQIIRSLDVELDEFLVL